MPAIDQSLDRLASLTWDNASQQTRVAALRRTVADRLAVLEEAVSLRARNRQEDALAVVRSDRGRRAMEEARRLVSVMQAEENQLLMQRASFAQASISTTISTFAVATGLGLLLVGVSYYLTRHVIPSRERTEAKFRGLLESAADAMVVIDQDGRILLVNSRTETFFGYARDELVGREVEMLLPERFLRLTGAPPGFLLRAMARPVGEVATSTACAETAGEFPVEINLSPLKTDEGVLVSSSIRDVTVRKQAEEVLRERTAQLHVANTELKEYVAKLQRSERMSTLGRSPAGLCMNSATR